MDPPKNRNPPFSNSQEEDDALYDFLNTLSPLKDTKYYKPNADTRNSLGMEEEHPFIFTTSPGVSPDDALYDFLNTLSPLKEDKKYYEPNADTLNSLGMEEVQHPFIFTTSSHVNSRDESISLSSQTPISGGPEFSTTFSAENVTVTATIGESGNSSGKIANPFQKGQSSVSANRTSESVRIDQMTSEAVPSTSVPTETDIRGCICKRFKCKTSFCECFTAEVKCKETCKCEDCENIHGRKDGTAETKFDLKETEALQISRT